MRSGFTLVELLLSTAVISVLCLILVQITGATANTWRYTKNKIEQFQAARVGFESMTRKISQATLNTYWDYDNPAALTTATGAPAKYIRQSELRFICGPMTQGKATLVPSPARAWPTQGIFFHAPLGFVDRMTNKHRGLENLLNVWGYFVEFGDDSKRRPSFLSKEIVPLRNRFSLMETMVPSENLLTYSQTSGLGNGSVPKNLNYKTREWFTTFVNVAPTANRPNVRVLAENIVALLLVPKLSKQDEERRSKNGQAPLSVDYGYDSTVKGTDPEINPSNQLPPVIQVTMVALDETSASRLADRNGATMPALAAGLFSDPRKLIDEPSTPEAGDGDLSKLEAELVAQRLTYRVFTTDVPIRAAKWSRDQK